MLLIPALRRSKQEDHEYEFSMSYVPYLKTLEKDQKVLFSILTKKVALSSLASFWMPNITDQWVLMKKQTPV